MAFELWDTLVLRRHMRYTSVRALALLAAGTLPGHSALFQQLITIHSSDLNNLNPKVSLLVDLV